MTRISRTGRWSGRIALLLALSACGESITHPADAPSPSLTALQEVGPLGDDVSILNPDGGEGVDDGLKIWTAFGAYQIQRGGELQIYNPEVAPPAMLVFGLLTEDGIISWQGPSDNSMDNWSNFSGKPFTFWSQSSNGPPSQSGSSWTNVETLTAFSGKYQMTVTTEYTAPNDFAEVTVDVTLGSGVSVAPQLYLASDFYLDGSDQGPGKSETLDDGKRYVVQYQTDENDKVIAVGGLLEVDAFTSYVEDSYSKVFGDDSPAPRYGPGGTLGTSSVAYPNTVNDDPDTDAGVGAHWDLDATSGTVTKKVKLYFGTTIPGETEGPEPCAIPGAPDATEMALVEMLGMSGSMVYTYASGRTQSRDWEWPDAPTRCTAQASELQTATSLATYWGAYGFDLGAFLPDLAGIPANYFGFTINSSGLFDNTLLTSVYSDVRVQVKFDAVVELFFLSNTFADNLLGEISGQLKLGNTVVKAGDVFAPGEYTFNLKANRKDLTREGFVSVAVESIFIPTDKTPTFNPLVATTTTITSVNPSPVITGSTYTVSGTVTVEDAAPGSVTGLDVAPTLPGSVTVEVDGEEGCTDSDLTELESGIYAFSCDITAGVPGEYTLTATYEDDSDPAQYDSSSDDETQIVEGGEEPVLPVISTTGGGNYTVSGTSVSFGHTVQKTGSRNRSRGTETTTYTGQLQWSVSNAWRFNGTVSASTTVSTSGGTLVAGSAPGFVGIACPEGVGVNESAACARFSGTGTLEQYNRSRRRWEAVGGPRTFTATVYDGGTTRTCRRNSCSTTDVADWFGLELDGSLPSGVPVSEPKKLDKALNGGIVVRLQGSDS